MNTYNFVEIGKCERKEEGIISKISEGTYFEEVVINLIIDRGFLRLVDKNDSSCLDSGKKKKINFCFNCGRKIE